MADENIALHECFERLKDTEQQKNALIEVSQLSRVARLLEVVILTDIV